MTTTLLLAAPNCEKNKTFERQAGGGSRKIYEVMVKHIIYYQPVGSILIRSGWKAGQS